MSILSSLAAAALAACVWVGGGAAQAAPGSAHGTQSPLPVDARGATQASQDAGGGASATKLREQALAAMASLREEIATLSALRDAQAALLAWNRETTRDRATPRSIQGAKTGAASQTLPAALCGDPFLGAWCPLLPATFGAPLTEDGHDRD